MTANDDNTPSGDLPPAPQTDRGPRSWFRATRAWVGSHGPQTLGGALLVAAASGVVSGAIPLIGGGGDGKASPGGPASPATTAPSCFQATCAGGDPEDAGCARDAETLADDWQSTMHVEVRYSPRCHVVWGKLTGAQVGDTIEIATSPSKLQRARVITGHTKYTKMLPVGKKFSAQATAVSTNGDPKHDIPAGFTLPLGADQDDIKQSPKPTP